MSILAFLGSAGALLIAVYIWRLAAIAVWLKTSAIIIGLGIVLWLIGALEVSFDSEPLLELVRTLTGVAPWF